MKLHYMVKRMGNMLNSWPAWKEEKICSDKEKSIANLRSLRDDEVCLDIEDPNQLPTIINQLCNDEYNFEVWKTGSRGYHIMLKFPEMGI